MNKKFCHFFCILLAAALGLSSCGKSSLENTYNNQETKIETFLNNQQAKGDSLRVVHNGSHRIVLKEGEGDELRKDGNIAFYYAAYEFSGGISNSKLFATNNMEIAESLKWPLSEEMAKPVIINLKDDELLKGLKLGLEGCRAGEHCYILFSGKYAFGKKAFGTIPANSALAYEIWVESISNE